jgi:phosphatidylglycerol:prolipoprotein diacylglycerol transferase
VIPYIIVKPLELGPITLQPFGLLVAAAVLVGVALATWRAKRLGIDLKLLESYITWVLVGGFVGGHVLDTLMYYPHDAIARPWRLLMLWTGLSSFGGFMGSTLGGLAWKYYRAEPWVKLGKQVLLYRFVRRQSPEALLPLTDLFLSVFPVAWIFGRAGCAVVHDHPGARANIDSLLAVAYGPGPIEHFGFFSLQHGRLPRYDLGLLEMLFTIVLAAAFALSWRRSSPRGWYIAAACIAYAPARFALDFLRSGPDEGGDIRYSLLTPAQWSCLLLLAYGVGLAVWLRRQGDKPGQPAAQDSAL